MRIGTTAQFVGGEKLPYDREVAWIMPSGGAFIDTGFIFDDSVWVCDARVNPTASYSENYGISQYASGQGVVYAFVYIHSSAVRLAYKTNLANYYNVPSSFFGSFHRFVANYAPNAQTLDVDESIHISASQPYVAGATESGMRIVIGGIHDTGGKASGMEFGEIFISRNGVDKRFVPVVAIFNGVEEGCMYDRANPTGGPLGNGLYRNAASSGAFTWGELSA